MIKHITLQRTEPTETHTYGVLLGPTGEHLGYTLEEPWKLNHPQISCIPSGTYRWRKYNSGKFGECLAIDDVPGRSLIRLHTGNSLADTSGCILLGKRKSRWNYAPVVLQSHDAVTALLSRLGSEGTLEITGGKDLRAEEVLVDEDPKTGRQEEKL